ncbi:MAG TPA: hypothetical protein VGD31_04795, partial [Sphingobacteriaceae bacterium]
KYCAIEGTTGFGRGVTLGALVEELLRRRELPPELPPEELILRRELPPEELPPEEERRRRRPADPTELFPETVRPTLLAALATERPIVEAGLVLPPSSSLRKAI